MRIGGLARFIIAALAIVLLAPPITGYLLNLRVVATDPSRFIEEYLKFLGSVTSVVLGFFLVHVLTVRIQQERRVRFLRIQFRSHLEAVVSLARNFGRCVVGDRSVDQQIRLNVQRIEKAVSMIEALALQNMDPELDPQFSTAISAPNPDIGS